MKINKKVGDYLKRTMSGSMYSGGKKIVLPENCVWLLLKIIKNLQDSECCIIVLLGSDGEVIVSDNDYLIEALNYRWEVV